jgi:hypothetical protein
MALEFWRDDVNAKGGLPGRPVELVYSDDQSNPKSLSSQGSRPGRRSARPRPCAVRLCRRPGARQGGGRTKGTDPDKLADFIRNTTFKTVVGMSPSARMANG